MHPAAAPAHRFLPPEFQHPVRADAQPGLRFEPEDAALRRLADERRGLRQVRNNARTLRAFATLKRSTGLLCVCHQVWVPVVGVVDIKHVAVACGSSTHQGGHGAAVQWRRLVPATAGECVVRRISSLSSQIYVARSSTRAYEYALPTRLTQPRSMNLRQERVV